MDSHGQLSLTQSSKDENDTMSSLQLLDKVDKALLTVLSFSSMLFLQTCFFLVVYLRMYTFVLSFTIVFVSLLYFYDRRHLSSTHIHIIRFLHQISCHL